MDMKVRIQSSEAGNVEFEFARCGEVSTLHAVPDSALRLHLRRKQHHSSILSLRRTSVLSLGGQHTFKTLGWHTLP
jgi:hypothetical protein